MAVDQLIVGLHEDHDKVYIFDKGLETFSSVTMPESAFYDHIVTDCNGIYVTTCGGGDVVYSDDDGASWTKVAMTHSANCVFFDGTRFVALAESRIGLSTDGATWTWQPSYYPPGSLIGHVTATRFGGSTWFAAGIHPSSSGGDYVYYYGYFTYGRFTEVSSQWWTLGSRPSTQSLVPRGAHYLGKDVTHRLISNDQILLGFPNGWLEDPEGSFTEFSQSGSNGRMMCGAYNPGAGYWIGGGADDDTEGPMWGYSADGKTWVKYTLPGDPWTFTACLFDGTNFWFAAAPGIGSPDYDVAAIFKMEPTDPANGTATFTRFDLPGTTVGGAWTLAGPSHEVHPWGEVEMLGREAFLHSVRPPTKVRPANVRRVLSPLRAAGGEGYSDPTYGSRDSQIDVSHYSGGYASIGNGTISWGDAPRSGDLVVVAIASPIMLVVPDGYEQVASASQVSCYLSVCQRRLTAVDIAAEAYSDEIDTPGGGYLGVNSMTFRGAVEGVVATGSVGTIGTSLSASTTAYGDLSCVGLLAMFAYGDGMSAAAEDGYTALAANYKASFAEAQSRLLIKDDFLGEVGSGVSWDFGSSVPIVAIGLVVGSFDSVQRDGTTDDEAAVGNSRIPGGLSA